MSLRQADASYVDLQKMGELGEYIFMECISFPIMQKPERLLILSFYDPSTTIV